MFNIYVVPIPAENQDESAHAQENEYHYIDSG